MRLLLDTHFILWLATDRGTRADEILRACVHCGFCNATCPTYQVLGDELDGRFQILDGEVGPDYFASHLDRRFFTCSWL